MTYSQKYTLVAFQEPLEVGVEFEMTHWPLHITLADVFAFELNADIEQKFINLFIKCLSQDVIMGDSSVLGTTNIILVEKNEKLQNLHTQIVDLLELNGTKFNNPEFTRKGFMPHVSVPHGGKLKKGDVFKIHSISLIDMFPDGDWQQRKVLSNYYLAVL
ncbi:MAG: hypothetical protein V4611_01050 [Patescibacteria group bacterium]